MCVWGGACSRGPARVLRSSNSRAPAQYFQVFSIILFVFRLACFTMLSYYYIIYSKLADKRFLWVFSYDRLVVNSVFIGDALMILVNFSLLWQLIILKFASLYSTKKSMQMARCPPASNNGIALFKIILWAVALMELLLVTLYMAFNKRFGDKGYLIADAIQSIIFAIISLTQYLVMSCYFSGTVYRTQYHEKKTSYFSLLTTYYNFARLVQGIFICIILKYYDTVQQILQLKYNFQTTVQEILIPNIYTVVTLLVESIPLLFGMNITSIRVFNINIEQYMSQLAEQDARTESLLTN